MFTYRKLKSVKEKLKLKKKKKQRKFPTPKLFIERAVELDSRFGSSRDPVMRSCDTPQVRHTTDVKSPFPDIIFLARVSFILLKGWGIPVQGCENVGKAPTVLPKFKSNPGFAGT